MLTQYAQGPAFNHQHDDDDEVSQNGEWRGNELTFGAFSETGTVQMAANHLRLKVRSNLKTEI